MLGVIKNHQPSLYGRVRNTRLELGSACSFWSNLLTPTARTMTMSLQPLTWVLLALAIIHTVVCSIRALVNRESAVTRTLPLG